LYINVLKVPLINVYSTFAHVSNGKFTSQIQLLYWKENNGWFACKTGFTHVDVLLNIAPHENQPQHAFW